MIVKRLRGTADSEEAEDTITIDFGCSTPTITVAKNSVLNEVRNSIESNWTLKQLREVTGVSRLPIAFSKDGEQIPFEQEWEENVGLYQWKLEEVESSSDTCDETETSGELEPSCSFSDLLLGMIGWNPPVSYKFKTEKEYSWALFEAVFFLFFFVLDAVDTVIDLATASEAIEWGTEGIAEGSDPYAILLFAMTILGRLLTGWYGVAYNRAINSGYYESQYIISVYFFVELCIFMMEDGAAALYLVNNPSNESLLDQMNLYLTMICGISCCFYLLIEMYRFLFIDRKRYDMAAAETETPKIVQNCCTIFFLVLWLYVLGSAISMVVVLATQVLPEMENVQNPISENKTLEIAWVIVYSAGTSTCLVATASLIYGLNVGCWRKKK